MSSLAAQTALILRNDLRLWWRDLRSSQLKVLASGTLLTFFFVLLQLIALIVVFVGKRSPALGVEAAIWLAFAFIMIGSAQQHATALLFERSDADLLLASPVSPRAVLLARLGSIVVAELFSSGFFLLPFLNAAVIGLSVRYAAGYLTWLLLALMMSAVGIGLTLGLVRWLGARRARIVTQIVGAVLGVSVYLALQLPNFVSVEKRAAARAFVGQFINNPVSLTLAEAGRGQLGALAVVAGATVLAAGVMARGFARAFVSGTQDASIVVTRRRRARAHGWVEGLGHATFRKDLRLIARDPLLLARVLPTGLYLLPVVLGMSRWDEAALLAPLTVALAGQFSMMLSFVAASGEECWDLILMSPASEARVRYAKMAAGMALPLGLALMTNAGVAALGRPGLALTGIAVAIVISAGCARLAITTIQPTPRNDLFKRNRGGSTAVNLLGGLLIVLGTIGVGLILAHKPLAGLIVLGVAALAVVAGFTAAGSRFQPAKTFAS